MRCSFTRQTALGRGSRSDRPPYHTHTSSYSAPAAGLGRTTPHASPRWLAVDDVTAETYH